MKTLLRALLVLALLASAGICFFFAREGVETDVYALVGGGSPLVSALARASATRIRVLCDTPADAAACRAVATFDAPLDPQALYELIRTHGAGLLSDKHRELLAAGETNKIVRSALRRDYTGVGLFPKAEDPYYLLNDFVLSFKPFQPQLKDGQELLTGTIAADDRQTVPRLLAVARAHVGVHLSGTPFHTFLATEASKREINTLGILSLLAVFLVGGWLFRGLRFVAPLALTLGAGFLVGSAALFLLPGRPHVLTFLFGTTLIGLGVDYCYHGLARARPTLVKSLTGALVTTCLAFAPLCLSSVAVLNQMAVFTMAGLLAIYACVMLWVVGRPDGSAREQEVVTAPLPFRKLLRVGRGLLLLGLVFGLSRVTLCNDPKAFHRMDPLLKAGEQAVAEETGLSAVKFRLVDLEQWQQENVALKARLGAAPTGPLLTAADLPPFATVELGGCDWLLLPSEAGVDLAAELQEVFNRLARETYRLLILSCAALFLIILFSKGRKFFAYTLPLGAAILATLGMMGWLGESVSFFQILCFFVLMGLAIDYVIFHQEGGDSRTVFASFLTSVIGFGLLAFTSFAVTRSMGLTLGIGLFFAYLFSIPSKKATPSRGLSPENWAQQKEQSAGKVRLALLWLVYRILGKNCAKIVTFFVVIFIYPFAKVARRALAANLAKLGTGPRAFTIIRNFAWSMIDKTDVCTLKKNLPRIVVTGDRGWMQGGCFLLSTHVGCIEVLPALRQQSGVAHAPHVHAFQQMGHDAIFTRLFLKYLDRHQLTLHAVEEIGVETAGEMQEAIQRGEIVLMAGDRPSAAATATLPKAFFGESCVWPKGVFRFAALMECPVYAITCVRTGWNDYTVCAKRLGDDLLTDYVAFLETAVRAHPDQWYQFYPVFP